MSLFWDDLIFGSILVFLFASQTVRVIQLANLFIAQINTFVKQEARPIGWIINFKFL